MKERPPIWRDQPNATEFAEHRKRLEAKGFYVSAANNIDTAGRVRRRLFVGDVQPQSRLVPLVQEHEPTSAELKVLILCEAARDGAEPRSYIITRLLQFHQTATRKDTIRKINKYVGI